MSAIPEETNSTWFEEKIDPNFDKEKFKEMLYTKLEKHYPDCYQQKSSWNSNQKMLLNPPALVQFKGLGVSVKTDHPKFVEK